MDKKGEAIVLSVVVPVYNEQEALPEFHRRLSGVLDSLPIVAEIVYVNDGSRDHTLEQLRRLKDLDGRVTLIDLSRNFGKEIAMTAGLDHAMGEAVVIIDADLQDPPELIPRFLEEWKQGHDVVYAKRNSRAGETSLKKSSSYLFYRLIQGVSRVSIPEDTGDFRLLSRRALDELKKVREQHRFMKGLYAWIGFSQKAVLYNRDARYAGETKWNYWKLWNFAIEGITSFTIAPLRVATYLGLAIAIVAFLYAGFIVFKTLVYGNPVAGYPSLMVAVLFLGGVQLLTIGIMGEYVGRMFDETKNRPLYVLSAYEPSRIGNPDLLNVSKSQRSD